MTVRWLVSITLTLVLTLILAPDLVLVPDLIQETGITDMDVMDMDTIVGTGVEASTTLMIHSFLDL